LFFSILKYDTSYFYIMNLFFMKPWVLLLGLLILARNGLGQKPVLDSATTLRFGDWPSVDAPFISNDGKFVHYLLNNLPKVGVNTLVAQSTAGNWKHAFTGIERGAFSADSKRLIFEGSGDSVCIVTLGTDQQEYCSHIRSFQLVESGDDEWLVCAKSEPAGDLVMRSLVTGRERKWSGIKDYVFSPHGRVLVWREEVGTDSSRQSVLHWEDLASGKRRLIWTGAAVQKYVFDTAGHQLAFLAEKKEKKQTKEILWHYSAGQDSARILVDERSAGIDSNLRINGSLPVFSRDGKRIFFELIERPIPQAGPEGVKVDVWNYKDIDLQSWQVLESQVLKKYAAVIGVVDGGRVIRLQHENEELIMDHSGKDDQAIAYGVKAEEGWWNKAAYSTVYWINTVDGSRKVIRQRLSYVPNSLEFSFSPNGHWVLHFDRLAGVWDSYDIKKGTIVDLSKGLPYPLYNENTVNYPTHRMLEPVGVCGWLFDSRSVLLYDDYDLWQVDPSGETPPINITKGYGRQYHIKFRVAWAGDREGRLILPDDTLLLSAFDCTTKYNGFYRKVLSSSGNPERLYMGPYVLYAESSQLVKYSEATSHMLWKARDGTDWILMRRCATEAPNVYTTRDFKTYRALSDCEPQKKYNWLTTELVHWRMLDRKQGSGILYKPEDFDPGKKYPVIFLYYEQRSDNLYDYPTPSLSYAEINIPYYVSRGYLVFEPDIYYKIGHTGESVVNSVVSAAFYLSKRPYIDGRYIGLQGHSFGGSETNYLVTHTHLFAAAAEGSGESDAVSSYNGLMFGINGDGSSAQFYFETSQGRIGTTLWQRPDLYIENSPVFRADRVTTPLLMMHNKRDGSVPFSQAVEMFTALRRLSKRVWLLQYDEGTHAVLGEKNQRDYTIRTRQFFDYYLKGALPPIWMTEGIPARWKGIRTGYEPDSSGRKP
jgi:dienelactone hydrolase